MMASRRGRPRLRTPWLERDPEIANRPFASVGNSRRLPVHTPSSAQRATCRRQATGLLVTNDAVDGAAWLEAELKPAPYVILQGRLASSSVGNPVPLGSLPRCSTRESPHPGNSGTPAVRRPGPPVGIGPAWSVTAWLFRPGRTRDRKVSSHRFKDIALSAGDPEMVELARRDVDHSDCDAHAGERLAFLVQQPAVDRHIAHQSEDPLGGFGVSGGIDPVRSVPIGDREATRPHGGPAGRRAQDRPCRARRTETGPCRR